MLVKYEKDMKKNMQGIVDICKTLPVDKSLQHGKYASEIGIEYTVIVRVM